MASFSLKVTRLALHATEKVSPRLAGRLAFELFSRTPARQPKGDRARRVFQAGEALFSPAERISFTAGQDRVAGYRFGSRDQTAPRVLVVHGWGSRAEYMAPLSAAIAKLGFEVIVIDFPGHGRSSGKRFNMLKAVQAIAAAADLYGPFDSAVGHSFGGAALMAAAGGIIPSIPPVMPGKIVTIASPSEMAGVFRRFAGMAGLSRKGLGHMMERVRHVAGVGIEAFDIAAGMDRLSIPVLTVHAEDDKEVAASHALRYANSGGDVRLYWANGLGHRRIISDTAVIAEVTAFLRQVEDSAAA